MERSLKRRLVGAKAPRQLQNFLDQHLPALETPASAAGGKRRAERVRGQMLEPFLRGHDASLLSETARVEWGDNSNGQGLSHLQIALRGVSRHVGAGPVLRADAAARSGARRAPFQRPSHRWQGGRLQTGALY